MININTMELYQSDLKPKLKIKRPHFVQAKKS
ncbi:hypothetical protein CbuK_1500 [Coxiella burnetii CbuK_Q154]|uniref:Uncharacterized protein n=1 Tax=Coxiella burnetii (strain Dugway 5J108-111) TaxID=434922 RepID=B5XH93_COXBN|nr:hypothetical protein CBUD_0568a [Coxiella burnetii Dugway 5J108-111]ACJ20665.1 hypothetical protein CbuK_1500 [Coxiella burnetii CbuK_Q154]AIT63736.1 hypothetical protein CBNA_1498 [Coxiella burnetii str. Namibia]